MRGDGVETVFVLCVDVWIAGIIFSGWVVGDVEFLGFKILRVANPMFVVTGVPYIALELPSNCEREAAFNELETSGSSGIEGWCDENVDVVRHDDKGVESEAVLIAIAEEGFNHQFGICSALKDAVPLVGKNRDGVSI
jgi:hypothetical protein